MNRNVCRIYMSIHQLVVQQEEYNDKLNLSHAGYQVTVALKITRTLRQRLFSRRLYLSP